jgi:integrase
MSSWAEKLPSGKYQARYTLPDGTKRSAGTHAHKSKALKEAAIAEAKARSLGWRDPKAAQKTWGEWCEAWWPTRGVAPGTLARDASPRDRYLMERWGDVPLVDITRLDVKAWAADLARSGLAESSVQRHLHLFSASLTAAIDAEVIAANPAYRLNLRAGETDEMRFLTHDEANLLLAEFSGLELSFTSLLLGTGMRFGEAAGLHLRRVDFTRGQVRVAETWDDKMRGMKAYPKGRKIRDVPLPDWVAQDIPRTQEFIYGPRIYSNWRNRVWAPAVERSGIGHLRPHDLRHTYASWLIQNNVSLPEVGRLLGHVSPTTTQRYAHLAEVSQSHILGALPDPRVGKK